MSPAGLRTPTTPRSCRARAGVEEASNFSSLEADAAGLAGEAERFGPDAIVASGFSLDELAQLRALLDGMGASFVRVVVLTEKLRGGTLREALECEAQEAAVPARNTPRLLLLSGMSGAEAVEAIEAIEELGLPPAIFAAAVPKSVDKRLEELFAEIEGDHATFAGANS